MLDIFKEISVGQADLIKSFAIFYLLLIGNYIAPSIFTCFQINFIKNNNTLQLFIAFLLFFFLVTLLSNTGKLEYTPPIQKLLYSIFYFLGFLVAMRLDILLSVCVLFLIFLIYFIELNKDFYLEAGDQIQNPLDKDIYLKNQYWFTLNWPFNVRLFPVKKSDFIIINKIETVIYYLIIFLLVIGFISYGGEIHDTLKRTNNLTWIDIITDTSICRLKDRRSFWHYLKVGLGIKI
jgi:hypothetical protein